MSTAYTTLSNFRAAATEPFPFPRLLATRLPNFDTSLFGARLRCAQAASIKRLRKSTLQSFFFKRPW